VEDKPAQKKAPEVKSPLMPQKKFCTNCGNVISPTQVFCTRCGKRVK
jgi:uncharacterized OB-fold protein